MRRVHRIIAAIAAVGVLILGASAIGPSATGPTQASAHAPTAVHDRCFWFRPGGAGWLVYHSEYPPYPSRETGCMVVIDQPGSNLCWFYYVRWFGGWNGPQGIRDHYAPQFGCYRR